VGAASRSATGHPAPPKRLLIDLENAATEQVAFWFQNRNKLGEIRNWPAGGNYIQLADTDLILPSAPFHSLSPRFAGKS
jgi:hypothetical protein